MRRFTDFTLAHRRWIALVWLALTIAGGWAASSLSDSLSPATDAPGRPAFQANEEILRQAGSGGVVSPIVAVARLDGADARSPAIRRELRSAFQQIGRAVPGSRTASAFNSPGARFASRDGSVAYALIFPPPGKMAPEENPQASAAASRAAAKTEVAGRPVGVTGVDALRGEAGSEGPGLLIEVLLGGFGALLVLIAVFASRLAFVPIVVAAISILSTFLVLRGLAALTEVSFVVQFLVGLIGLGVAIDYSLLVVVRWREERDRGLVGEDAVRASMATAGKAVIVSGTTVAIGLLALVVVPVPFIRSIGFGGLLIPLVSVIVCLTLLPGLLASLGQRLDHRREGREAEAGRGWTRWSEWVVRRRIVAALVGLVVLGALAVAATTLEPGQPSVGSLTSGGAAQSSLQALERAGLGDGVLKPIELIVDSDGAADARQAASGFEGVTEAVAPQGRGWTGAERSLILAVPREDVSTGEGRDTLDALRDARDLPADARVGGPTAQDADLTDAIYGSFPLMALGIAVITFLLLARALRSLLLPLKAVLLNVLSIGAAFGIVVLIWQDGFGSELIGGVPATGTITNWVPLAIFAFLYGLSMDYEVFILARMREEYDATGSTHEAIVRGLGRTGRLVTSAALILFLAFVALAAGPNTELKIFATGLAAGILLDATVVRALVVPALVQLLGRANWWLPGWAHRVLRTGHGPA